MTSDAQYGVVVIDAHAHVWDPGVLPVPWIGGTALDGPRLPSSMDAADIAHRIFVEADMQATPAVEVDWVASLDWPELVGIVADIDLRSPSLRAELCTLADKPLVRGVRHLLQNEHDAQLADPRLPAGVTAVGQAGLAFDACVAWRQLPLLADVLAAASGTRVILDHCGKPPVDDGIGSTAGQAWLDAIRRIADHEQVFVKLSGLRAEASDATTFAAHAREFLDATLAVFGAERAMFATDWPVSTGEIAGVLTAAWLDLVRDVAGADWSRVAAGTAREAYRLV